MPCGPSCMSAAITPTSAMKGALRPASLTNETAIEVILTAIHRAGFVAGRDVVLALDPAATELYRDGRYHLTREGRVLSSAEMVEFWADWTTRYPIKSIEDGPRRGRLGRLGAPPTAARQPRAARRR